MAKDKRSFTIAAIIGAVVGVVGGLLFAPKSGKETRTDIKEFAGESVDKVKAEYDELEAKAKKLAGSAAKKASTHVSKAKHAVANVASVAKAFKSGNATDDDLKEAVESAKES